MNVIRIGDRLVGEGQSTYIIAEIGINHNGILEYALKLIDIAVDSGADAVKFQKRQLDKIYPKRLIDDPNADEKGFQYMIPFLREMELSDDEYRRIVEYCRDKGITFLCSAWDTESADFLESLGMPAYKIASPDMTNLPLLEHVAAKGKPLIVSTGMSTFEEVKITVEFLKGLGAEFALLHCNSTYPCPFEDINLRFMDTLRQFGVPVGYSGHERGIATSTVAAALGACIIERHITLDRTMEGPDHAASLEPQGLRKMIRDIRQMEAAMGTGEKYFSQGEVLNREILGKSLVAVCSIRKGETITRDMIAVKCPGKGLSPQRLNELLGRVAVRDLEADDLFFERDLGVKPKTELLSEIPWDWGVIVRFRDVENFLRFEPKIFEFHFTYEDLNDPGIEGQFPQRLFIHAPEWWHRSLLDLCARGERHRRASVAVVQQTIERAREMAPHFAGQPTVIAHPGAMSLEPISDARSLIENLRRSVAELDADGVTLLFENLPPRPWYFGGQWITNAFMDAHEIRAFCEDTGFDLCFDTCHTQLYCNLYHLDPVEQIRVLKPFIRHLHVSDASGIDGEGLQIGEGMTDFKAVFEALGEGPYSLVPEIWRGHHNEGESFLIALERLARYFRARECGEENVQTGPNSKSMGTHAPSRIT